MWHDLLNHLQVVAQSIDISTLPKPNADNDRIQTLFNIVLTIMGAVGVLILSLAGIRFMTSRGNPQEAAKAKNAILYTVIGLVVVAMSLVMVNFVVTRIT
ncbi:MAG TPA: pilin [Candidatus Saccharimonadales bacterium]|nr:pilin [Candidatus Saccharimonadales bacterium]